MEVTAYQNRRDQLLEALGDKIAIIPAAGHQTRSFDTEFPFRQNSNFRYLTGYPEHDAILVLAPRAEQKEVLFVLKKDAFSEMWNGRRYGTDKARDLFGIPVVHELEKFDEVLPSLFTGHRGVAMDLFNQDQLMKKILTTMKGYFKVRKKKEHWPKNLHYLNPIVGKLRLKKDQNEILFMRESGRIAALAHRKAMQMTVPGKNEHDVQAMMEYVFRKEGAYAPAYGSIVAGGNNANILHYVENNQELKSGDLLLIDAGAEFHGYASDITRTFPVNGKFSSEQAEIYSLVLQAQKDVISVCRPGKTLEDLHQITCRTLTQGLIDLDILKGKLDEELEKKSFRKFFPHSTGHWLGLDVHDESPYLDENLDDLKLEAGMCFTVEPGLYFSADDPETPERYKGIGVRIEDDILITAEGHENLTSAVPKELKEVEAECAKSFSL